MAFEFLVHHDETLNRRVTRVRGEKSKGRRVNLVWLLETDFPLFTAQSQFRRSFDWNLDPSRLGAALRNQVRESLLRDARTVRTYKKNPRCCARRPIRPSTSSKNEKKEKREKFNAQPTPWASKILKILIMHHRNSSKQSSRGRDRMVP